MLRFNIEASGEDALKRAIGCLFVINMPASGLEETLGSLREAWEFWHARSLAQLPKRTGTEATARVVGAQVRPQLVLSD